MSMSWAVTCPSCHRHERWDSTGHTVEMEGGQRRPHAHPTLAAWRTINRSLRGDCGPVAGRCSACEQPLIAVDEGYPERIQWTFTTPKGEYVAGTELHGPDGQLSLEEFDAYMTMAYPTTSEKNPAQTLFTMTILTFMTVPVLLWVITGIIVATILLNFTSSTQVFVPGF